MSSASEDFSPVLVTPILTDTALPPGLLLMVVLVSIVGMMFILLVLWYFLSGRARQVAKMNHQGEEDSFEVLREGAAVELQQSYICYQDRGLLVVPRVNPGCSPSIFSAGMALEGGLGSGEIVTASVHTNTNNEEALEMESVDLDSPPVMDTQLEGLIEESNVEDTKQQDFLLVKNTTVYTSSMSLNVFSDCHDDTPTGVSLQTSEGGNSPNVSFRSAINTFRPKNSRSMSTSSIVSTSNVSPVYKFQFEGQGSSSLLPQKKKDPLCDQDRLRKEQLNLSMERGTEF